MEFDSGISLLSKIHTMKFPLLLLLTTILLPALIHAQDWDVDQALMRFTYEDTPGPPPAGPLISRWEMGIDNNFVDPNSFSLGIYKFVLDYIIKENAITIKSDDLFTGMGTDDPLGRLHINYSNTIASQKPALLIGETIGGANGYLMVNKPNSDVSTNIARFRDNGSTVIQINETDATYQFDVEGDIIADSYHLSSDARLKDDIKDIHSAKSIINQIRPRSYSFKSDNQFRRNLPKGKHYGVLAQELQKVLPELVRESESFDEEGNSVGSSLSVNYIELIPFLISANQELSKEIEQLRAEVAALKN